MRTALVGGVLIDGSGGAPRRDATLVIEGSKIVDVGHQRTSAPRCGSWIWPAARSCRA